MNVRVAFRKAVKAVLDADPYIALWGVKVVYRPKRAAITLPAVTMYDVGVRADSVTPTWNRTLYVDVWSAGGLDEAEEIAALVNGHLDLQPIPMPDQEGRVERIALHEDRDVPMDDADLTHKTLVYEVLLVEWNGPRPFGEAG